MRWFFLTHLKSFLCAHVRELDVSWFHQFAGLASLQNLGLPFQTHASILWFLNEAVKGPLDQSTLSLPPRVAQLSPFHRLVVTLIGCRLGYATPLSAWFLYVLMGTQSTMKLQWKVNREREKKARGKEISSFFSIGCFTNEFFFYAIDSQEIVIWVGAVFSLENKKSTER